MPSRTTKFFVSWRQIVSSALVLGSHGAYLSDQALHGTNPEHEMEHKSLEELRRILIEGQRRSKQGSYMRRNPASAAIPFLLEARSGLKNYVREKDTNAEALRLLSQAEECLLNYSAARQSLERAISLSVQKDKKDMKRLAVLTEHETRWTELGMTPSQLEDLGNHLSVKLSVNGCSSLASVHARMAPRSQRWEDEGCDRSSSESGWFL